MKARCIACNKDLEEFKTLVDGATHLRCVTRECDRFNEETELFLTNSGTIELSEVNEDSNIKFCICGEVPKMFETEGLKYLICQKTHVEDEMNLIVTGDYPTTKEAVLAWNKLIREIKAKNSNLPADPINHPRHYQSDIKCKCGESLECIDFVRHCGYNEGNIIKYVWRYKEKGGIEDLKKAQWYLNDLINSMEIIHE